MSGAKFVIFNADDFGYSHGINRGIVEAHEHGVVTSVVDLSTSDVRINGGFFACKRELLDEIQPGDELVEETFSRLIPRGEVVAYPYEGFFGPMDTIKDRQRLESLLESGKAPWRMVGRPAERAPGRS